MTRLADTDLARIQNNISHYVRDGDRWEVFVYYESKTKMTKYNPIKSFGFVKKIPYDIDLRYRCFLSDEIFGWSNEFSRFIIHLRKDFDNWYRPELIKIEKNNDVIFGKIKFGDTLFNFGDGRIENYKIKDTDIQQLIADMNRQQKEDIIIIYNRPYAH